MLLDRLARENRFAAPEAAVHFLQRHDVGADLVEHREDAVGISPAVDADGLVDVVAGERELHGPPLTQAAHTRSPLSVPWWL